jgi:hypothetical protein
MLKSRIWLITAASRASILPVDGQPASAKSLQRLGRSKGASWKSEQARGRRRKEGGTEGELCRVMPSFCSVLCVRGGRGGKTQRESLVNRDSGIAQEFIARCQCKGIHGRKFTALPWILGIRCFVISMLPCNSLPVNSLLGNLLTGNSMPVNSMPWN